MGRRAKVLATKNTHILRCPFLIGKHHAINDLDAGEPTLATRVLQFLQNDAIQLLVMHEIFQSVALNSIGSGELLECWLGGYYNRNRFSFVFRCVDTNIRNDGGGTVDRFELSGTLILDN